MDVSHIEQFNAALNEKADAIGIAIDGLKAARPKAQQALDEARERVRLMEAEVEKIDRSVQALSQMQVEARMIAKPDEVIEAFRTAFSGTDGVSGVAVLRAVEAREAA